MIVSCCLALAGCGGLLGSDDPGPPPDATSEAVAAARVDAVAVADRALDEVVEKLGGTVVGRASDDACYQGQNNWKVDDGYGHRCTVRRAVIVSFDGDFRQRIAAFDERLFDAGWRCYSDPCHETLTSLLREYWDSRAAQYGDATFPISSLPTPSSYDRDGLELQFNYAGADPSGRSSLQDWHRRRRGGVFESYERSRPLDVAAVLARGESFAYLVALAVERDYFES